MQLSVFGLGHAGAVVAGCLVSQGHEVIAFDHDPSKVDMIRCGVAPVNEPGLEALLTKAVESGRLTATTSVAKAIANSVLSSICLQLSTTGPDSGDLAQMAATCTQIGVALGTKTKFHSVVLRMALPPGTTRGQLIPALERASGKRAGADFGVAVYPSLLRRGTAIQDCVNPPAILIGVTDDETLARLREMEIALQAPEMVVDMTAAEAIPHANRSWMSANVTTDKRASVFPAFPVAAGNLSS
jgi:GDP-mannose 6-dehydrogenase